MTEATSPRGPSRQAARILAASILGASLFGAPSARAEYPDRPIRLVVPFAPGGGGDVAGRIVAPCATRALGQPVVVENRPGAGGTIGTDAVAKAAPDGYTLAALSLSSAVLNAFLYRQLPYDTRRDLTAVSEIGRSPNIVAVRTGLPVTSLQELMAYVRRNPGRVTYGSGGSGTTVHLSGVLFGRLLGTEMTHVPYRGGSPALTALVANEVDLLIIEMPTILPQLRDSTVRALALTATRRAASVPDVPTTSEAGLQGFEMANWFGIYAPARTPRPIVDRISTAIARAVADPDCRSRLTGLGIDPAGSTPDAFSAFWDSELSHWGPIVRESGARVD
jgi:tripartite-type tricarboxylate transporter receptor subunit TctC